MRSSPRWVSLVASVAFWLAPTASRGQDCVGTCYDSGAVSITDLIIGVSIALGGTSLSTCPSFDPNQDQQVTIDELLLAVLNASEGCGPHFNRDKCAKAPPLLSSPVGGGLTLQLANSSRDATDPTLSCACAASPHTVWATYDAPTDGVLHARLIAPQAGYALAILGGVCGATSELACRVNEEPAGAISLPVAAGTRYLFEVTAPCEGAADRVQLKADLCGDGETTGGETCDDGNSTAGDGCDAQCRFEGVGAIDSQSGTCNDSGSINLVVAPIGQLFVPSVPALAAVDLLFGLQWDDSPQQVTLRLRAGALTGALLAEQSVTTRDRAGRDWYHFRFAAPVTVTPGQIYAIDVVTDGGNVSWNRTEGRPECPLALPNGGGIAAGRRLNGEDLAFRTYAAP
ncbi:MAG: hypothetical protein SF182_28755 [Deltaproteobacteria bacterium]|nr:hypothetical protein [Deltaproteobacteria bacterium]